MVGKESNTLLSFYYVGAKTAQTEKDWVTLSKKMKSVTSIFMEWDTMKDLLWVCWTNSFLIMLHQHDLLPSTLPANLITLTNNLGADNLSL